MFKDISASDIYSSVTPSDSVNLSGATRGIYVGVGGTIVAIPCLPNGQGAGLPITFVGVPSGTLLPISCLRINATGTSAASIVALF